MRAKKGYFPAGSVAQPNEAAGVAASAAGSVAPEVTSVAQPNEAAGVATGVSANAM